MARMSPVIPVAGGKTRFQPVYVDDVAAAGGDEVGEERAHTVDDAPEVDAHQPVQIVVVHILDPGAQADASVVDHDIGAAALGGITGEMLLGHWFLVDPTLPRWSLISLDVVAVVGLSLEVAVVVGSGSLVASGQDSAYSAVYVALAVFCGLLMVGVWGSLREPRYSGVMAATGLSYLAVLVAFGVVTVGRSLVAGSI